MKSTKYDWPILIVSGQFHDNTDEGFRLNELVNELEEIQKCSVIPSFTYVSNQTFIDNTASLLANIDKLVISKLLTPS